MSILATDLFIAASKASKVKKRKKKRGSIDSFSFEPDYNKDSLKNDLEAAEKIFQSLKVSVSSKKLKTLAKKINTLRKMMGEEAITPPESYIEHEGGITTPPLLDDLYDDLNAFDDHLHKNHDISKIPGREESNPILEPKTKSHEIQPLHTLLNIPPPPRKV